MSSIRHEPKAATHLESSFAFLLFLETLFFLLSITREEKRREEKRDETNSRRETRRTGFQPKKFSL